MSKYHYTSSSIDDLDIVVYRLIDLAKDYKLFLFQGDLGLGKTTLIKKWMAAIGVQEMVSSPSYSIINEYQINSIPIYHMDCYRLETPEEAQEIGIEEYLYSGHLCVVEWPGIIGDMIPLPYVTIKIEEVDNSIRKYTIVITDQLSL